MRPAQSSVVILLLLCILAPTSSGAVSLCVRLDSQGDHCPGGSADDPEGAVWAGVELSRVLVGVNRGTVVPFNLGQTGIVNADGYAYVLWNNSGRGCIAYNNAYSCTAHGWDADDCAYDDIGEEACITGSNAGLIQELAEEYVVIFAEYVIRCGTQQLCNPPLLLPPPQ